MELVDEVKAYLTVPSMDSFALFDIEDPVKPVQTLYRKEYQLMQETGMWIVVVDVKDRWMKVVRKTWLDSQKALHNDLMAASYEIEHNQTLDLSDGGERWEGDVMNNQPCGWGVLYDKEGEKKYEGFRLGNVNVCYGVQYYAEIGVKEYEGEWCEGMRWGRGKQYDRNGVVVYDGEWLHDEQMHTTMIMYTRKLIHNHITELLIYGDWTKKQVKLSESFFFMLPHLEFLIIGDICFSNQIKLTMKGMPNLKRIKIGNKSFKRWYYFYGCNSHACFTVADCPQLLSIEIGNRSFLEYGNCEFQNLPSLEWMKFGYHCFQWASLELRGDGRDKE